MGVGRYGFALQGKEIKHRVWLSNERNKTQSRSTTRTRTSEELLQSSKRLITTIQGITRYGR